MTEYLSPWLRCPDCDKIHTRLYIGPLSRCACGRELGSLVWEWKPRDES